MSSNKRVTEEDILSGFADLHAAITLGFANVDRRFEAVQSDIAQLEHRVMRRFDDITERLDNHETRITKLESGQA